jgi:ATP-binding cassette, subfamily C, bacterial LapB
MSSAIKHQWRRPFDALKSFTGGAIEPIRVTCSDAGITVTEPKVPREIYFASLVINLLALGLPLVNLQVYDRIIPNHARETLAFLVIGLALALVFDLVLRTMRSALLGWHGMHFVRRVEHEAVTRLVNAPPGTIESEPVAVHVNRFAALAALGNYHAGSSRLMAIDLPFVLVTLTILTLVGGLIVLVPISLFFIFAALAIGRSRDYRKINEERSIQDNKKYDFVSEVLAGILTVKGMAMEPQMLRRFERLQQSVAEITMRSIFVSHAAQSSAVIYGSLSQIVVVAFGAIRVIDGQMSIGALACCMMLSGQALQPLLRAISLRTENEVMNHRRVEIRQLLALPVVEATNGPPPLVKGGIHFDHVCFERPSQKQSVLRDICISVTAGTVVGLIGSDGSGRTTVLKLLLGDLVPTHGCVMIDDIATTDRAFANIRPLVAYVGPNPVTFRGTILENLTNFQPHRRNCARQMAILMGLEESVNELPNGYDTMVGESIAEGIPASLAQQMTIVRALSTGARVLLLDEANAVLDRRAETSLIEAIDKLRGDLTLIIATHRPSVLAKSDIVYTLIDGQLVDSPIAASTELTAKGAA